MTFLSNYILLYVAVAVLGYIAANLIFTIYLSPLSRIPNAGTLAPISRLLWAFPSEHRGRITLDLPLLHQKYGPLVRIGPNELSVYSLDIYKTVYGFQSPFTKDPRVYGQFVQGEHPGLFSITDPVAHSQRRRLMGQLFNRSKMSLLEGMMLQKIQNFTGKLKMYIGETIDCGRACRALEADIISTFGFGQEIGALNAWANREHLEIIMENDRKSSQIAFLSNLPAIARLLSSFETWLFGITGWETRSAAAMKDFDLWAATHTPSPHSKEMSSSTEPLSPNLISTMLQSLLPLPLALSEAKEMLGPGTDTVSATLSHILFALASSPSIQNQLIHELDAHSWPKDLASLEQLPLLKAVVKEGVRWTGAATAMLPRVVPAEGVVLEGIFIPGGTVLGTSPTWYLHDPIAFPSPKSFRPFRWLDTSLSPAAALLREEYYVPFSKGSAACIGMHFSYLELYLALSQILKGYEVRLPGTKARGCGVDVEAELPERLEWVAAVPVRPIEVVFWKRGVFFEG